MSVVYQKKAKTQGHLRTLIRSDYQNGDKAKDIAKKYEISNKTTLKQGRTENLENNSSVPIMA